MPLIPVFADMLLGIEDDVQRRDSLHALVNNLPDAHYATLRALVLVCVACHLFMPAYLES